MSLNFTSEQAEEAIEDINSFFGTSLSEFYLTIEAAELSYKGEGYALIGQNNISFFNDKMENVYSIQLNMALEAKINGNYPDDITMQFQNEVLINAEK